MTDNNFVTTKEVEEYVSYRLKMLHSHRWALMAIWIALFSTIVFYAVWKNHNNTSALKQSRLDIITNSCIQQNDRHDATIIKLDELIAKVPAAQAAQAKASRAFTVLLIDTIVPKRKDCAAYAKKQIKESHANSTATR